jgi:hypothetical protein
MGGKAMTFNEMKAQCLEALAQPAYCWVILTIPKGKMPKGFPRGELLNEHHNGDRTYSFDPFKVLRWVREKA